MRHPQRFYTPISQDVAFWIDTPYTWDMTLPTPKEPKDIKAWMERVEGQVSGDPTIKWDSYAVWAGNKLPQYLWSEWKDQLKPAGYTWQKFTKILSHRTDNVLLWYRGLKSWPELVKTFDELINGPIGKGIAKG
jgi:hypothetical protein